MCHVIQHHSFFWHLIHTSTKPNVCAAPHHKNAIVDPDKQTLLELFIMQYPVQCSHYWILTKKWKILPFFWPFFGANSNIFLTLKCEHISSLITTKQYFDECLSLCIMLFCCGDICKTILTVVWSLIFHVFCMFS